MVNAFGELFQLYFADVFKNVNQILHFRIHTNDFLPQFIEYQVVFVDIFVLSFIKVLLLEYLSNVLVDMPFSYFFFVVDQLLIKCTLG